MFIDRYSDTLTDLDYSDDSDLFTEEYGDDAAEGELVSCLDRIISEIGDNPEGIDDLRWELELMKCRLGSSSLH